MISDTETFLSVVKQYEKPKININYLFRVLEVIHCDNFDNKWDTPA